jgi:hypothetical protein
MELSEKLYGWLIEEESISGRFELYMLFRGKGLVPQEAVLGARVCEGSYMLELRERGYSLESIPDKFERLESSLGALNSLFDFGEN